MNSVNYSKVEIIGMTRDYPFDSTTFKQLQIQETVELPSAKPDMEQIVRVTVSGEVLSTRIIEIPQTISNEGQILTGKKLIVEGSLKQKIEYIADNTKQSIHAAEFVKPFSSFIMLEEYMDTVEHLSVNIYIEDVYIKQINSRKIFRNVILLLNAFFKNHQFYKTDKLKNIEFKDPYRHSFHKNRFFSQFTVEETIAVPKEKPELEQIVASIVDPEIVSMKFISTLKGISAEGQVLTGKKAILEIKFRQKILYVADLPEQSMHGLENVIYKSAYIVVPCLIEGTDPELLLKNKLLKPQIIVEDIFTKRLDDRHIFKNISVFIELKLVPTFELCYSNHNNCTSSRLFMMYSDGSCIVPITGDEKTKCARPQWSPLGNEIAYIKKEDAGDMLYLLNLRNLKSKRIIPPDKFDAVTGFCFMPDGKSIIFTAAAQDSKDIYVYDIGNQSFKQLTDGRDMSRNFKPSPSPDGSKIAYIKSISGVKNLWIMDVSGKNHVKLTKEVQIGDFQWTTDGSRIIYSASRGCSNDGLYMVVISSGEVKLLLDNIFIRKLRISPDGKYAAITSSEGHREDLLILELSNKKLTSLTNNDSYSGISDFVWNIDSKALYYSASSTGYYDIYSAEICNSKKEQLTNINSSFIELSYRPSIR